MKDEFERISHAETNYKIFIVDLLYRTPHIHKDFEICLLLEGQVSLILDHQESGMRTGSLWVTNPFQSHELIGRRSAKILSLQVSAQFFSSQYPQMKNLFFLPGKTGVEMGKAGNRIRRGLIKAAVLTFEQKERYELKCAALINHIFDEIMEIFPYRMVSDREKNLTERKAANMREIAYYIDHNFSRKLLLTEIAQKEHLTLGYLSHFFKEAFGMSFQEYLLRIRCEEAERMLTSTDFSLLDISIACGFSDVKYLNRGFRKLYGYTPREYRRYYKEKLTENKKQATDTSQEFMTPASGLEQLEKYLELWEEE